MIAAGAVRHVLRARCVRVRLAATIPTAKAMPPACVPLAKLASMIASLEKKPAKPKLGSPATWTTPTPVIASVPATIAAKVIGILRHSPP